MWSPTHVQVTVLRARNLQSKGRKGTNDAFVLIQMGKDKFQTTVKEKSTDPEWYEECDLTLIGRDSDVTLTAYHRNVLGLDEFLGQTHVSLEGIENFDRPFTKWYTLAGKTEKSTEKNRGELEVKIAFIVQRCNDTQSLNDLSIRKKKHSIKNLAVSVGHKIQKLPSRTMSLRNLDPRKRIEKIREKRQSVSSTGSNSSLPEDDDDDDSVNCTEDISHISMKRHASLYSSTLSLPQSAMITSTIEEAGSLEDIFKHIPNISEEEPKPPARVLNVPVPPIKKNTASFVPETKSPSHGEWTNRVLAHIKESPVARSETNIMDALKSESPSIPTRKSKIETIRNNIRRHTLHLSEPPPEMFTSPTYEKRNRLDVLRSNSPKKLPIPEGIPPEVIQQFERMDQKDLVLLAVKQQGDLERQRDKILDLENYLDNLLVRVMETTPRILQKPYVSPSCSR